MPMLDFLGSAFAISENFSVPYDDSIDKRNDGLTMTMSILHPNRLHLAYTSLRPVRLRCSERIRLCMSTEDIRETDYQARADPLEYRLIRCVHRVPCTPSWSVMSSFSRLHANRESM
jgi:hypothetical protein